MIWMVWMILADQDSLIGLDKNSVSPKPTTESINFSTQIFDAQKESGLNGMVLIVNGHAKVEGNLSQSGQSEWIESVQFPWDSLGSSIFHKTVHFQPVGLYSCISVDRPVSSIWALHFRLPFVRVFWTAQFQTWPLKGTILCICNKLKCMFFLFKEKMT